MKNKRHARRVKRLALICTMCTIILVVSTYAWFIGMRTVNVNSFDVEIAATKGLYLSINGKDWYETLNINKDNFSTAYTNNTNTWSEGGLIPISSVGEIDSSLSRLIMYEKGSLTTTDGGYRLMASRVKNYDEDGSGTKTATSGKVEGKGFVAFDLFVKNLSGSEYYGDMNVLNEEAIFLTQNSAVTVTDAGTEQDKTGIENSVRVAFAQIGRVNAEVDDQTTITGITCATDYDKTNKPKGVTGICSRYAQIWEPNDTKHVQNALNWYTTSCKQRDAATGEFKYKTDACNAVTAESAVDTYAVGNVIDYTNYVDVYDGINGYTGSVATQELSFETTTGNYTASTQISTGDLGKLYKYNYFTDTEKMRRGLDRPIFMTLAPNSITKVRVYIYIEGQDVDNYDFASLGRSIKVNFGFTKERFYGTDIQYNGPTTSENGTIPATPEAVADAVTVDSAR